MKRIAPLIAGLALLAGCSTAEAPTPAAPPPSPTSAPTSSAPSTAPSTTAIEKDATYRSVEDLRDAAKAAGYYCLNWQQTDVVKLASESGTCSDSDVFSVYATQVERDEQILNYKAFGSTVLAGPNWIINSSDVTALEFAQDTMGGMMVRGDG